MNQHIVCVRAAVVRDDDLIGQDLAWFGNAIAIGVVHPLVAAQLGGWDHRGRTAVGVVAVRVTASGITTGGLAVDRRLIANFDNTSRDRVVDQHLEAHRGCPAIGRNRRNRPGDNTVILRTAVVRAISHIGRVGGDRVLNRHVGGRSRAVVGDDDCIGQNFTRFGQTITITTRGGVAH